MIFSLQNKIDMCIQKSIRDRNMADMQLAHIYLFIKTNKIEKWKNDYFSMNSVNISLILYFECYKAISNLQKNLLKNKYIVNIHLKENNATDVTKL